MCQNEEGWALTRILGLGFGIAVIFGGTVGVGIFRLPGTIAGQLLSFWPIVLIWIVGACYALLGATISVAELGAALPQAGGFYVYAKRAFGLQAGFAVGWADWLNNCAVVAYGAVTAGEYLGSLAPALALHNFAVPFTLLLVFCSLQWAGLRLSSFIQQVSSSVTAITFLLLAGACLLHAPAAQTAHASAVFPALAPLVGAFRAIVVTYDGWYEAIYFTEEDTDAARHLPRALIGCVLIVLGLCLLMNLVFLHVLSIPVLSASKLPAADAAQIVFPGWGGAFVTLLALLTLLSLINAVLLGAPRILFSVGRDGLFSERAAQVGPAGTPRAALVITAASVALFIASGKLDDIIAIAAILVAALYSINYFAVIVLRIRQPKLVRPFRTWGYPLTTVLVLSGSLLFLGAAAHDDPTSALRAVALLAAAIPVYTIMRRRQSGRN